MDNIQKVLTGVLLSAKRQGYRGFSKFDALNSPALEKLSFGNKWLRLLITQAVKSSPLHIRPLLGVKRSVNPKGVALFARAYLFLYQETGRTAWRKEAEKLLLWLLDHPSRGQKNLCWGYDFIWQNTIFLQDRYEPNAIVTTFAGEAMIHAYRVTHDEKYLDAAGSIGRFITEDLPVISEDAHERAIAYVMRPVDAVVLNNQVLTAAFLIKLWRHTQSPAYYEIARKQIAFTVRRRTSENAWFYTDPPHKSPITHDNYHTGGILDGLLEFQEETGDPRFESIYKDGLAFYQSRLFEEDGAPRWMSDKKYPYDVHGAAQGIITFAKAARHWPEYQPLAQRVLTWSFENLYRPSTRDFMYRRGRWMKWNYSLMRWCNAWMARAMAEYGYQKKASAEKDA